MKKKTTATHTRAAGGERKLRNKIHAKKHRPVRIYGKDITRHKAAETAILKRSEELIAAKPGLLASEEKLRASPLEIAASEAALRESESKLRIIFETSIDAIGIFREGIHHVVNPAYLTLFGYPDSDDLAGKPITDLIAPSERRLIIENIQRRARGETAPSSHKTRGLSKDGTEFDMDVRASNYELSGVTFTILILRDITERKRSEEALRASEEKCRMLFQNMAEGFALCELLYDERGKPEDWRILEVNAAYTRHTGLTTEQIAGQRISKVFPAALPEYLPLFSQVVATQTPVEFDIYAQSVDRYLHVATFPAGGHRFASTIEDITQRKRAERMETERNGEPNPANQELLAPSELNRKRPDEALQVSEFRYRRLFESAKYGILTLDAETGEIVDFNAFLIEILGYTHSMVTGKKIWELGFMKDIVADRDGFRKLLQKEYIRYEDIPLGTGDGRIDVEFVSNVYLVERTKVIQCYIHDITERKRMEAELLKYRESLEHQIEQRTSELAERTTELAAARRLSDIGTLASTVAHELRNPLAAIRMAVYNIKRKAQLPALDSHLATIDKKVSDSDQIIKNLLFYSRIKAPDYQPFDISALLDEAVEEMANRYARTKPALVRAYPGLADQTIEADPLLLRELFENVLSNALEAIPGEHGAVEVSGIVKGADDLEITVADNGPGIGPETLSKVFEPFFSTKSKGTGLGLAVCRQIVRLHGGSIAIASEPGRGTTVAITIPLRKGQP